MKTLAFLALCSLGAFAAERPNFVFILTDDHRQSDLGCYGNEVVKTPNIDRLADEGVLFENASITSAICTPSRISYLLGQFERRHGVNFNSGTAVSSEAWSKSYPVLLRESGYFTGYVGKNHSPIGDKGYKTGLMEKSFDYWYAGHGHINFYPKKVHEIFRHAKNDTQVELIGEGAAGFLSGEPSYLGGAENFLAKRPKDQPFCLSICLNVPHGAGTGTMKLLPEDDELYRSVYRDQLETLPLPPHYTPRDQIKEPRLPADVLLTEYRQKGYNHVDTEETVRERRVRHYQTITGIDRMVGAIRKQLAEIGAADNTVIILSADHGLQMGEFGLGGKALNYEVCLATPFIVYDPRLPEELRGQRRDELVQSIDVAPTLLDLAVVDVPGNMQGASIAPLLNDEPVAWRTHAFAENLWSTYFGNPRIESVRSKRWKYIRYFKNDHSQWSFLEGVKDRRLYKVTPFHRELYSGWLSASIKGEKPVHEELFDLENDPHEATNLASSESHEEVLEIMRGECQRLVAEAHGPVGEPRSTLPLPLDAPTR